MRVFFKHALKSKKVLSMLLLSVFLGSSFMLTGCATLLGGGPQGPVSIKTNPENAKVSTDTGYYGKTPISIKLKGPSTNALLFQMAGYKDAHLMIHHKFKIIGILNILFLPGFLIDYLDGAMFRIKHNAQLCYGKLSSGNCKTVNINNDYVNVKMVH
jgi:hypothetical protein